MTPVAASTSPDLTPDRTAARESLQVRELAALARLGAETGGQSLCVLSRDSAPVPSVKYHEGAAAALAEVRRSLRAAERQDPDADARSVLRDVRERWSSQSRSPARTGPGWVGYFAGGLDALQQLVDDGWAAGAPAAGDDSRP